MRRITVAVVFALGLGACGPASNNNNSKNQLPGPIPPVLTVTPANGAMGVSVSLASIVVTSSVPLDPASVAPSDVTLSAGSAVVTVTTMLSSDGLTLTIGLPSAGLQGDTTYSLFLTGVKSTAADGSLAPASPLETTFTTVGAAPSVQMSSPDNMANGVGVDIQPTLIFTEPMTDTTPSSITIFAPMLGTPPAMSPVTATVTWAMDGRSVVIEPTQATCQDGMAHTVLCEGTLYSISVGAGLTNAAGVSIPGAPLVAFSFTTEEIPPQVATITPADMTMNVMPDVTPTILFTHQMDPATLNTASTLSGVPTITLTDMNQTAVGAKVSLDTNGTTATVTPLSPLTLGTEFLLTVTASVEDYSDVPLESPVQVRFTTPASIPTVTMINPANNAMNVLSTVQIVATFSEPVTNVTGTTFTLQTTGTPAMQIAGTVSPFPNAQNTTQATFSPTVPLSFSTGYQVIITPGVVAASSDMTPLMTFTSTFTTGTM